MPALITLTDLDLDLHTIQDQYFIYIYTNVTENKAKNITVKFITGPMGLH